MTSSSPSPEGQPTRHDAVIRRGDDLGSDDRRIRRSSHLCVIAGARSRLPIPQASLSQATRPSTMAAPLQVIRVSVSIHDALFPWPHHAFDMPLTGLRPHARTPGSARHDSSLRPPPRRDPRAIGVVLVQGNQHAQPIRKRSHYSSELVLARLLVR